MTKLAAPSPTNQAHRQAFMDYCTQHADPSVRPTFVTFYRHFAEWNTAYFGDRLTPPHLLLVNPKMARALGDFTAMSGWGSTSQIRIRPSIINGTHPHFAQGSGDPEGLERFWLDVALHECVHLYCHEVLGKPEYAEKGHGLAFAAECTRIGALLDLPPVGPARKSRNRAGLESCAQWLFNVRPDDYYLGAYRPDLASKRSPTPEPTEPREPDEGEGDDIDLDDLNNDVDSGPLSAAEWQQLQAATRKLGSVGKLVDRLAAYHGIGLGDS